MLRKTSIGYYKKNPLSLALLVLGIALGVALVVSIDIANSSVEKSFQISSDIITGKTTHQIVGTYGDVNQSIYVRLRNKLGLKQVAPVITGRTIVRELGNRKMQILGIDPLAESGFRTYSVVQQGNRFDGAISELMSIPNQVLLHSSVKQKYGLQKGDSLTLVFGKEIVNLQINDFLELNEDVSNSAESLLYTDIATAQEILRRGNQISHIDLIIPDNDTKLIEQIKELLPADVKLIPAAKRRNAIRQMSKSFEFNLQAFSLLALLVGMFLIYNTITFSVLRRRKLFGILRAIGVTRQELLWLIIKETLVIAIFGTILGLFLGVLLGNLTVQMVSQTVSSLYFSLIGNQYTIEFVNIVKAVFLGLLVSLSSAIFPAIEASRVQPASAMARSQMESKVKTWVPYLAITGLFLALGGCVVLNLPFRHVTWGFVGAAMIVFAFAFVVPFLTYLFSRWMNSPLSFVFGVTGKIAARAIPRSISRTGVSIAALMVAVCVYIGVGIMISSFKESLAQWVQDQLKGEIHLASSDQRYPGIEPDVLSRLQTVSEIDTINQVMFSVIASGKYNQTVIFATDQKVNKFRWIWLTIEPQKLDEQFHEGIVFVSESFAWKHSIRKTDNATITLETPIGSQQFRIGGVFSDFFVRGGRIVISDQIYRKYWNKYQATHIEIILKPDSDAELIADQLNTLLADRNVELTLQTTIYKRIMKVFDNTFTITVALQLLSALVAFIGIFNTIMALTFDRLREIGVLRANGMDAGQLWRMILIESGLMGMYACLLAIPLGTILSWILIAVINKRSFGWTLNFTFEFQYFFQAILLSLSAAILAGIYPAFKTSRINIIDAIRTE